MRALPHGTTIPDLEHFFSQFRCQLQVPARCNSVNAQDLGNFFATAARVIAEKIGAIPRLAAISDGRCALFGAGFLISWTQEDLPCLRQ